MCFDIHPRHTSPYIAKKDIKCYKIGKLITPETFKSLYYNFEYVKGETYHVEMDCRERMWYIYNRQTVIRKGFRLKNRHQRFRSKTGSPVCIDCINEGFHSYQYKAPRHILDMVEMIIPKGAKYWNNDTEYVSDTIKWP